MTTLTIYQTTCNVCEYIADKISNACNNMIKSFEVVGTARAASQLASMGYYKEAEALMLQLKDIRKELEATKK